MTTAYTEYFAALSAHAARVAQRTYTWEEFGKLQHMGADIIDSYQANAITQDEYRALKAAYFYTLDEGREVLHNEPI